MVRLSERLMRGEDRPNRANAVAEVAALARPWNVDGDQIMGVIGDARFVLIGDATHGTNEFYRDRARLTRRLIVERGFASVAIEADREGTIRVDQYVRGFGPVATVDQALTGFRPFPTWMWRNAIVAEFIEWLREHNRGVASGEQVGVHGLIAARLISASGRDPVSKELGTDAEGCRDPRRVAMAQELLGLVADPDGELAGRRVVIWAHNTHVGGASRNGGDVNLGQTVRERFPGMACLIGFTTGSGTIAAASEWEGPVQSWPVPPSLPGSWESLLHRMSARCGWPAVLVPLRGEVPATLADSRLLRGIGVVYHPESERYSHYRSIDLIDAFDAVVHIDVTTAQTPLGNDAS